MNKKSEKICLKFTGYVYMPRESSDRNDLRYYASCIPGRLIVYDEQNEFKERKTYAFSNYGAMMNQIEKERSRRIKKRVKKQKMVK